MPEVRQKVRTDMEQEEVLKFFDDFAKSIGLDYMVFASTLLGIIREGRIMINDIEVDVCVHGDDLTDEIMSRIDASGHRGVMYPCKERYGEFYLYQTSEMLPSTAIASA